MDARQFLLDSFPQLHQGQLGVVVGVALEKHAHELAEVIREAEATQWPGSLADLIDPEVS